MPETKVAAVLGFPTMIDGIEDLLEKLREEGTPMTGFFLMVRMKRADGGEELRDSFDWGDRYSLSGALLKRATEVVCFPQSSFGPKPEEGA